MPELPDEKFNRFKKVYGLNDYDSEILTRERNLADYFEESVKVGKKYNLTAKQIANVLINRKPNLGEVLPAQLIQNIVKSKAVTEIGEKELDKIIEEVIKTNENAVLDYKNGKENAIMFLVGQVMRKLPQKVDASQIKASLLAKIK